MAFYRQQLCDATAAVRTQLVALASRWSEDPTRPANDIEHAGEMLLSAAFYLYSRPKSANAGSRFADIANLLDDLVQR